MELFAIILWVIAAVLFTASFDMLRSVNPETRLPFFFGRPPNNPPQVALLRLFAFILFLGSAWVFSDAYGRAAGPFFIVLGALPGCIRNHLHNRRVSAASEGGA